MFVYTVETIFSLALLAIFVALMIALGLEKLWRWWRSRR